MIQKNIPLPDFLRKRNLICKSSSISAIKNVKVINLAPFLFRGNATP